VCKNVCFQRFSSDISIASVQTKRGTTTTYTETKLNAQLEIARDLYFTNYMQNMRLWYRWDLYTLAKTNGVITAMANRALAFVRTAELLHRSYSIHTSWTCEPKMSYEDIMFPEPADAYRLNGNTVKRLFIVFIGGLKKKQRIRENNRCGSHTWNRIHSGIIEIERWIRER
jgi:hypothetical protein